LVRFHGRIHQLLQIKFIIQEALKKPNMNESINFIQKELISRQHRGGKSKPKKSKTKKSKNLSV
tara:strand:- start:2997 stop:3188 length:192 start_codon:yes stop_codon:yes gene_type:complete